MERYLLVVLVAGILAFGPQAYAHHSFAATYFEDQSVTIEGELVRFLFRNPHSFAHVMVREKDGRIVPYAVEMSGAGQLGDQGLTKDALKPGDYVIITGKPGRNPADHSVRMVSLRRVPAPATAESASRGLRTALYK